MLRVRDLGPLAVAQGNVERPCAGQKQAAILAMLAMHSNHRVPIDDLTAGAWGYDTVVSTATVENHVWRLRRLLDPGYSKSSGSVLLNDSGGYRLRLPIESLDSATFELLAEEAGRALGEGRPAEALASCDEALSLWRGAPYDVVAHVSATAAVSARLEEIRGRIIERRIDAKILCHRSDEALADLEVLTHQFPYRERLWGQRMTALAAGGRTEEALATYQRVRTMMRDELGIDPGSDLQRLQHRLLTADADLGIEHHATTTVTARTTGMRNVHLPRRRLSLVGRDREMAELRAEIAHNSLVTVTGPGGSGKTRLAIEVARRSAERFVDGVWFTDLTAVSDPHLVPDAVASTIGLRIEGTDVVSTLNAYARDRRIMLLLDNCEHVLDGAADLAEAVAAPDSSSVLLVTSRQPLSVDGERVCALAPLLVLPEDEPGTGLSEAAELFFSRLGREPARADEVALVEGVCRAVDGLPLAIELAAARAQTFTLEEILVQVSDDPSRLGRIGRGNDDHRSSLWSTIDWSHRLLKPTEQAIHRRLAALPGHFTLPAATAVAQGTDLDVADVPEGLARLVHRSLLVSSPPDVPGRSTVFRQLDTVRAHARHLLEETGESTGAMARRDRWVTQLLVARPRLGDPASKAYYDNLDDAYAVIRASLQSAVTPEPDPQLLLAGAGLHYYWYYRHRVVEGRRWAETVVDAGLWGHETQAPRTETVALRITLAGGQLLSGDVGRAQAQLDLALPFVARVPDDLIPDLGEVLSGTAQSAWARNEYGMAQKLSQALAEITERTGDPHLLLLADAADCVAGLASRDPRATARQAEALYERAVSAGNLHIQWTACAARMIVAMLTGDPEAGIRWVDRLIPRHAFFGSGGGGAFLEMLANFATLSDDHELAIRMYAAGYAETRRVGMVWPIQLNTADLVERTRAAVAPDAYDRLWAEGSQLTYEQVARDRGLGPLV